AYARRSRRRAWMLVAIEMFEPNSSTDPDCKPSKSAMSLKETWPADDEVVLDGTAEHNAPSSEGLTLRHVVGDGSITPGRYRFTR
ncbi:MAG TPA: hypothetical protein VGO00_16735, partial [Kofleriaceae bacterium]|nr:hypothetical protein [Kofleriaceae bacterium]